MTTNLGDWGSEVQILSLRPKYPNNTNDIQGNGFLEEIWSRDFCPDFVLFGDVRPCRAGSSEARLHLVD